MVARRPRERKPLEDRFWEKVDRHGPVHPVLRSRCWVWTANRNSTNYGMIYVGPHDELAHRISYQLQGNVIPPGYLVLHRCDNRPCVRPSHLFVGTQQDNMRDMAAKGRQRLQRYPETAPRGEKHPEAVLTDEGVRQIRAHAAAGMSQRSIGALFGITHANVGYIVRRKTWKHIQ